MTKAAAPNFYGLYAPLTFSLDYSALTPDPLECSPQEARGS